MKRVVLALLGATVFAAPAHASGPLVPRDLAPLARYAETLVEVDPGSASASARLRDGGGRLIHPTLGIWVLPSRAATGLIPELARSGALREFSPDRPLLPASHVDSGEPLLAHQWWLAAVGADRVEPPGPGVPVTVIDSGLDLAHPEFAGRPDTELLNEQTVDGPREFHGTAVASIVAAPVNGVGIVGVYPAAVLRSWDVSRVGRLSTEQLVAGLAAAAQRGRGVVNVSLGAPSRDPVVEHAVLAAFERGAIVVAASGNDGEADNAISFPAGLPHVLTVTATTPSDEVAAFSSRSPAVDLAAPGESIPAAVPISEDPEGYALVGGTSFAAPIVAGAAAWLWTLRPELDKTQVIEILRRSARDIGAPGRDPETGFGILDIPTALAAPAPAVDPFEPNDDVDQVSSGGLFGRAKAPLTRPGKGRATVLARLDRFEDPVDVHRIWVPAGRRVTVNARSARDLDLELWRPQTRTILARGAERRRTLIARSARPGGRIETVTVANRGGRGGFVLASVSVSPRAALPDLGYTLTVTTAALPPRR